MGTPEGNKLNSISKQIKKHEIWRKFNKIGPTSHL